MAFSINTNTASMEALASLRATNASLTTTENQVSTGKKVNSASDDPAIYAISQTMNSQVSELSGVSTGLQVTAQVISTAQTQASSSSTLLSALASTLTEGQTTALDATTINETIVKTLAQIDANANGATFKGVNLLAGATGNGVTSTTAQSAQDLNGTLFAQSGFNATSAGLGLDGLNVNQSGLQLSFGSANPTLSATGTASTTVTLKTTTAAAGTGTAQDIANTTTFSLNDGSTAGIAAVNALLQTSLTAATTGGTISSTGQVSGATSTETNADGNKVYTFPSGTTGAAPVSLTVSKVNGNDVYTLGTASDANGNTTSEQTLVSVNVSSAATETGTAQVGSLMSAMQDQGFGVTKASATGDLLVAGANLDTSQAITTSGTGAPTATVESGSEYALAAVNAAIDALNKISSSLGSSSNEVTGLQSTVSSLSDALTTGVGALTDADLSSESARLTSLQTKQSLAIQSLSIANSQSQSLLTLFR